MPRRVLLLSSTFTSYHARWKPSPVPPPKSTSVLILINPAKMPTCSLTANIVFRHMRSYATAGSPSVVNLYQASACMFQVLQFSPLTLPAVMPSPVRTKPALRCAHLPSVSVSKNLSRAGYLSRMFWMETFEKLRNTVSVPIYAAPMLISFRVQNHPKS